MALRNYAWKAQNVEIPQEKPMREGSLTQSSRFAWNVKPNLRSNEYEYLSAGKAFEVEIIRSNKWQRPIQFSFVSPISMRADLDEHLQLAGLAYLLVPYSTVETGKAADADSIFNVFRDSTNFRAFRTWAQNDIPRISRILNCYRSVFLIGLQSLLKQNRLQEAENLLAVTDRNLPEDAFPGDEEVRQAYERIRTTIVSQKN
jgi:hypothetical protein